MISNSETRRAVITNHDGWYTIKYFNGYNREIGIDNAPTTPDVVKYLNNKRNGKDIDITLIGFSEAQSPYSLPRMLKENGFSNIYFINA